MPNTTHALKSGTQSPDSGDSPHNFSLPNSKPLWKLVGFRQNRCPSFIICLQIHHIRGLPSSIEGLKLTVNWGRSRNSPLEKTHPISVVHGVAEFDEVFLHYSDFSDELSNFWLWVLSDDSKGCEIVGAFELDLSELVLEAVMAGNLNSNFRQSRFGGKTMRFGLCGVAGGGTLSASFYCRVVEGEGGKHTMALNKYIKYKKKKGNCCSCIPNFNQRRKSPPLIGGPCRVTSLDSDPDYITIENSPEPTFVLIEKSLNKMKLKNKKLENEELEKSFNEVALEGAKSPCLLVGTSSNAEIEIGKVEDEFLRMLDENNSESFEKKGKENVGFDLDLDLDLDCIMKAAEMEIVKAIQACKSKIEGTMVEKAECEELMKRWGLDESAFQIDPPQESCIGFGSPI
ncbi:hypothetical protein AMTRI_Chr07g25510 [Amborella trichopoda]